MEDHKAIRTHGISPLLLFFRETPIISNTCQVHLVSALTTNLQGLYTRDSEAPKSLELKRLKITYKKALPYNNFWKEENEGYGRPIGVSATSTFISHHP